MQNFFLILTGVAIGSHILVIAKLLTEYRHIITARILSLKLVGATCYMLQPFVVDAPNFLFFLQVAGMATPALFWMFASTLFAGTESGQKLHSGHYVGLVACLTIGVLTCAEVFPIGVGSFMHVAGLVCTSLLVFLGLSDIVKNWKSDLVECRRLLRVGLAISSGVFLLSTVVSEFIYGHGQFPDALIHMNIAIISFLSLGLAYVVLISTSNLIIESIDDLASEAVVKPQVEPSVADSQWLKSLNYAMEVEYRYREVDLTIGGLAEYVNIPEHQLRRLINQHLGYRNFNDYLNRYRVRDAAERLADPTLVRTPILTIAIESGYASLTTFNKAFKALKEMTPSEFRRSSGLSVNQELTDY
ncbi:helix-turn-helix domain-containing protein [Alteromonadaceae bacterium M269]|nr:helix-turn-helix domain-containing protein [Alteromonadaceae bacterium M269]